MTTMEDSCVVNGVSSHIVVDSKQENVVHVDPNRPIYAVQPRRSSRHLQARVGREKQRYDGKIRLLACIVVSRRPVDSSADEFLLISSSKHSTQWILPKGGWETDESIVESAVREADEEAGVCPTS